MEFWNVGIAALQLRQPAGAARQGRRSATRRRPSAQAAPPRPRHGRLEGIAHVYRVFFTGFSHSFSLAGTP